MPASRTLRVRRDSRLARRRSLGAAVERQARVGVESGPEEERSEDEWRTYTSLRDVVRKTRHQKWRFITSPQRSFPARKGQSVVASAAYRSSEALHDERYGLTHDYTRKEGVEHSEILPPEGAPEWMRRPANLVEPSRVHREAQRLPARARIGDRTARRTDPRRERRSGARLPEDPFRLQGHGRGLLDPRGRP